MPIKGLSDRGLAFPQIGSIRKGAAKDPAKNQPGADLQYFRMDFDEREVAAIAKFNTLYRDGKPTDINIILPFDDIERVWNPWREAYTAGALYHRCDGDRVNYSINPATGERVVMNWHDASGNEVKCAIQNNPNKALRCKPTGRLMVIVPELERLAYLVVHTTSIHDIGNISDQLAAIREMNGGHIAGVQLILRRRPVPISTPSGSDGKRARRVKWLISIEADPEWVAAKIGAMRAAALPSAERLQIAAPLAGPEWTETGEDDEIEDEPIGGEIIVDPSTDTPTFAPITLPPTAKFAPPAPPKPAPKAQGTPVKMASTKFTQQSVAEWNAAVTAFVAENPNWQTKAGKPDMAHIQASAAHAGFDHIDGDNRDEVFHMIVAAHESKAADARLEPAAPNVGDGENMP